MDTKNTKVVETKKVVDPKKAEKKAKKAEKKQNIQNAINIIKAEAEKLKNSTIIDALKLVSPKTFGLAPATGGSSSASKFIDAVVKANSMDENKVFELFKVGRKDCAGYIRKHLKNTKPEDRVWIAFDKEKGVYKVAGKGAKKPEGWTGPVPTEEKVAIK